MNPEKRITTLIELSKSLDEQHPELIQITEQAYQHNKWFTKENTLLAIQNIREQFLDEAKIAQWLSHYELHDSRPVKNVGVVMAGNIPLVGFHDFLCVFLSGHVTQMKLSSKDNVLFPFILKKLFEINPEIKNKVFISEIFRGVEAVIATGSNNSSRYFEYYFGKYPHIIRKNRSSVAVLKGNESVADFKNLGFDIFSYFGLGCRNVSKLYVPENYSFNTFFDAVEHFGSSMHDHNKYKNNYDYNRVLLLMNNTPFLTNDFLIVKEDPQIASPVSVLHYESYKNDENLNKKLNDNENVIQCIIGNNFIPFGAAQSPGLNDYADHVDTMKFLTAL